MQERRTATRFRANLSVRWETLKSTGNGAICDVSASGCFILTGGAAEPRELVRMTAVLPDEAVTVWGTVVYAASEMGFAVRFVSESDADRVSIERVISSVR
ncbi:MAG TPA: PilZ domain-containing protein [Pyrinomonadaceae bacterium]|nr:PilZ domain-containing protein [Pyrinomonadaceae bacterium]